MELKMEVNTVLTVIHKPNGKVSPKEVNLVMTFDEKLDLQAYLKPNGDFNLQGIKAQSNVLIQGLASSIHASHQQGTFDSAEHMRWAIDQLQKAFVAQVDIIKE